ADPKRSSSDGLRHAPPGGYARSRRGVREGMLERIERAGGGHLDLEALTGAGVVDHDDDPVVVLVPEERDLEAVAGTVGKLANGLGINGRHVKSSRAVHLGRPRFAPMLIGGDVASRRLGVGSALLLLGGRNLGHYPCAAALGAVYG